MKKTILVAVLAAFGLAFSGAALAEGYDKQKVVYHINGDDPKQEMGALRNIQNHINAVGADKLDLKVVLHGDGLALVTFPDAAGRTKMKRGNADDSMTAAIANLKNQGVRFQICANTLEGRKISYEHDLYDVSKSDIVPSGVAELAHLQAQGYTYIKP